MGWGGHERREEGKGVVVGMEGRSREVRKDYPSEGRWEPTNQRGETGKGPKKEEKTLHRRS